MKRGDYATAPSWFGPARLPVEILERPRNGLVLVRWLAGPLGPSKRTGAAGREARLAASTVKLAGILG